MTSFQPPEQELLSYATAQAERGTTSHFAGRSSRIGWMAVLGATFEGKYESFLVITMISQFVTQMAEIQSCKHQYPYKRLPWVQPQRIAHPFDEGGCLIGSLAYSLSFLKKSLKCKFLYNTNCSPRGSVSPGTWEIPAIFALSTAERIAAEGGVSYVILEQSTSKYI